MSAWAFAMRYPERLERLAILKVGGVASAVMIMLSLLLASTTNRPDVEIALLRAFRTPPVIT